MAYVQRTFLTDNEFGYYFPRALLFFAYCTLIFQVAAPMPSRVTWALLRLLV